MKITSLIILATILPSISISTNAQVTVSSFEETLPASDVAESDVKKSTLDTKNLANKLEAAGWKVQQDKNGNLIITRNTAIDTTEPRNNRWQTIKKQLQQSGWSTIQDIDGSLILIPPKKPITTTPAATSSVQSDSFMSMQQKLRDAGWKVTNTADGNILLYPPASGASSKPHPCPGIPQTTDIELPVDNWQKAHSIATHWLDNISGFQASIGKIRKILNVYIVSVVAKQAPHTLIQQIAIRSSDGAIIVLN